MSGRLILDEPAAGDWNMAVDAAILGNFKAEDRPTLRFYRWSQPTLSLGYFQPIQDRSKHLDSGSIDCVRRATGGGAIIHHHELTYSLTVPHASRTAKASGSLYQTMHHAIVSALLQAGITLARYGDRAEPESESGDEPFLCFQRRTAEDLVISGYKVCGSAQRRSAAGLLQHGSLLLSASWAAPQLPGLVQLAGPKLIGETSAATKGLSDLAERPDTLLQWQNRLALNIASEMEKKLAIYWSLGNLVPAETEMAQELRRERFGAIAWNEKR